ncbi:MAG: DUF2570 domain-containing protein [Enterobacteriaceae bacterium]|jgi:hypothetical protein|nr:DUF2570 domain-containing protein [Enterobacteriaceae bacterium]
MSRTIIIALALVATLSAAFAYHLLGKTEQLKADNSALIKERDSAEKVTNNVLRTVAIINDIARENQDAKQQIALEAQRTESDIKNSVASDDCANRLIPDAGVNRLREYANSLRTSSVGTDSN